MFISLLEGHETIAAAGLERTFHAALCSAVRSLNRVAIRIVSRINSWTGRIGERWDPSQLGKAE